MPRRVYHIALWVLLVILLFLSFGQRLVAVEEEGRLVYDIVYDYTMFIPFSVDVLFKAVMFYGLEYIHLKDLRNKKIQTAVTFVLTLATGTLTWYLYEIGTKGQANELLLDYFFPYSLAFHFLLMMAGLGYISTQQKVRLKEQKAMLEKERLRAEMEMLQAQINPHFLFNALNNIYAIARKTKAHTVQKSIATLAELMRYMTYESSQLRVSIQQELTYLENYIGLQKMRLQHAENVNFSHNITPETTVEIAPMLLIPYIENAFKHGAASGEISIKINYDDSRLKLAVQNKVDQTNELKSDGFGLKNSERRLALLYPEKHWLDISSSGEKYNVKLMLEMCHEIRR